MKVFTSYISNHLHPNLDAFYSELVGEWCKHNMQFASSLHIVTNVPSVFVGLPINIEHVDSVEPYDIRVRRLPYMKQYDYMMSTQAMCWRKFLETHSETCFYLDPDAILTVPAEWILNKTVFTDFAFYKKPLMDYYDVGTIILSPSANTYEWLDEIDMAQLKQRTYFIEPHISTEMGRYKGNRLNANILLRGVGPFKPYDIIHGMFDMREIEPELHDKYRKFHDLMHTKKDIHGR